MFFLPRALFFLGGSVSLGLGIAGAFLPVLPTTPFLLLSSYCFIRSSPRMHRWLVTNPFLGRFLHDWEVHRGVSRRVKIVAFTMMAAVLATSWLTDRLGLPLNVLLTILVLIGATVVWRLPVVPKQYPSPAPEPLPIPQRSDP